MGSRQCLLHEPLCVDFRTILRLWTLSSRMEVENGETERVTLPEPPDLAGVSCANQRLHQLVLIVEKGSSEFQKMAYQENHRDSLALIEGWIRRFSLSITNSTSSLAISSGSTRCSNPHTTAWGVGAATASATTTSTTTSSSAVAKRMKNSLEPMITSFFADCWLPAVRCLSTGGCRGPSAHHDCCSRIAGRAASIAVGFTALVQATMVVSTTTKSATSTSRLGAAAGGYSRQCFGDVETSVKALLLGLRACPNSSCSASGHVVFEVLFALLCALVAAARWCGGDDTSEAGASSPCVNIGGEHPDQRCGAWIIGLAEPSLDSAPGASFGTTCDTDNHPAHRHEKWLHNLVDTVTIPGLVRSCGPLGETTVDAWLQTQEMSEAERDTDNGAQVGAVYPNTAATSLLILGKIMAFGLSDATYATALYAVCVATNKAVWSVYRRSLLCRDLDHAFFASETLRLQLLTHSLKTLVSSEGTAAAAATDDGGGDAARLERLRWFTADCRWYVGALEDWTAFPLLQSQMTAAADSDSSGRTTSTSAAAFPPAENHVASVAIDGMDEDLTASRLLLDAIRRVYCRPPTSTVAAVGDGKVFKVAFQVTGQPTDLCVAAINFQFLSRLQCPAQITCHAEGSVRSRLLVHKDTPPRSLLTMELPVPLVARNGTINFTITFSAGDVAEGFGSGISTLALTLLELTWIQVRRGTTTATAAADTTTSEENAQHQTIDYRSSVMRPALPDVLRRRSDVKFLSALPFRIQLGQLLTATGHHQCLHPLCSDTVTASDFLRAATVAIRGVPVTSTVGGIEVTNDDASSKKLESDLWALWRDCADPLMFEVLLADGALPDAAPMSSLLGPLLLRAADSTTPTTPRDGRDPSLRLWSASLHAPSLAHRTAVTALLQPPVQVFNAPTLFDGRSQVSIPGLGNNTGSGDSAASAVSLYRTPPCALSLDQPQQGGAATTTMLPTGAAPERGSDAVVRYPFYPPRVYGSIAKLNANRGDGGIKGRNNNNDCSMQSVGLAVAAHCILTTPYTDRELKLERITRLLACGCVASDAALADSADVNLPKSRGSRMMSRAPKKTSESFVSQLPSAAVRSAQQRLTTGFNVLSQVARGAAACTNVVEQWLLSSIDPGQLQLLRERGLLLVPPPPPAPPCTPQVGGDDRVRRHNDTKGPTALVAVLAACHVAWAPHGVDPESLSALRAGCHACDPSIEAFVTAIATGIAAVTPAMCLNVCGHCCHDFVGTAYVSADSPPPPPLLSGRHFIVPSLDHCGERRTLCQLCVDNLIGMWCSSLM